MTNISTVGEYVRQLDLPQTAHLLGAAVALRYGLKGGLVDKVRLWSMCSAMYFAFAWLGFRFGKADYPLSYRFGPDPNVWRPVPGVIDLRTIDHVVQLTMGCVFLAAVIAVVAVNAWAAFSRSRPSVLADTGSTSG